MAMNKKEKEFVEELKTRLALRWTAPVLTDVPRPVSGVGELSTGYAFCGERSDYPRVEVACSSSVHHAIGRDDMTTTQHPRDLYSTRERALQALRYEVEKACAEKLRRIDAMLEAEDI